MGKQNLNMKDSTNVYQSYLTYDKTLSPDKHNSCATSNYKSHSVCLADCH